MAVGSGETDLGNDCGVTGLNPHSGPVLSSANDSRIGREILRASLCEWSALIESEAESARRLSLAGGEREGSASFRAAAAAAVVEMEGGVIGVEAWKNFLRFSIDLLAFRSVEDR